MHCYKCVNICPKNALYLDNKVSCIRLDQRPGIMRNDERCLNGCNRCVNICPLGKITLTAEDCSFCIVCKGKPGCILPYNTRESFLNIFPSIIRFMSITLRDVGKV